MSEGFSELGREVVSLCHGMGFACAGISAARATDHREALLAWFRAGKHGSMEWLARHAEARMDPSLVLAGAKSVIMVGDVYARGQGAPVSAQRSTGAAERGRIARYARGDDYHDVVKKRLHSLCDLLRGRFPQAEFRAFVDTAPVLEREHAVRAGLGWIGKHTLVIHPQLGSWMVLGGILTTLDLSPPAEQRVVPDHCGTCTRCIDACPTRAITPYEVDARRCISYLTIERREAIPEEFHAAVGDWLFGCDICQEVCPHNRDRRDDPRGEGPGVRVNPAYTPRHDSFDLLEVLGWTEGDRRAALSGSAMKRAKLDMWKRNALVVAGNALFAGAHGPLVRRLEEIARDERESDLVRETARAVLKRRPDEPPRREP
ncbi:MAG: tRNA epoxyqueuosine(34) reductase QueG [Phycisphaerae bacterium]|nr:tRNA epoxyqueuosine(34) reductase QueG [Phycisphaerae bacterium]